MKLKELPWDLKSLCYCDYTLHLINSAPPASINFPIAPGERSFQISRVLPHPRIPSVWYSYQKTDKLCLCVAVNQTRDRQLNQKRTWNGKLLPFVVYLGYLGSDERSSISLARFPKRVANYYQT